MGRRKSEYRLGKNQQLHLKEIPISKDFYFFQPSLIQRELEEAGLAVEEIIERDPHPPEVEHQSRRAYILARRPE